MDAIISPASSSTANDGSIDLTISGGVLPYQVLWNTGAPSEDLLNVSTGDYWFELIDSVGCSFIDTLFVPFIQTIQSNQLRSHSLYPNPAANEIIISKLNLNSTIEIYNLLVHKLISITCTSEETKVNIQALPVGTYILKIKHDKGSSSQVIDVIRY